MSSGDWSSCSLGLRSSHCEAITAASSIGRPIVRTRPRAATTASSGGSGKLGPLRGCHPKLCHASRRRWARRVDRGREVAHSATCVRRVDDAPIGTELDVFPRHLHECLFERSPVLRELVQHDPVGRRELTDLRRRQAADLELLRLGARHRDLIAECELPQARCLGRAHPDDAARRSSDELLDAHVGEQLAAADHDQVVGGQRHLAHQVARRRRPYGPPRRAASSGCGPRGCPRGRGR